MDRQTERTTRDRIIEAALPIFASLGYDGTDNEMIANAAGVSRQEVIAAGAAKTSTCRSSKASTAPN